MEIDGKSTCTNVHWLARCWDFCVLSSSIFGRLSRFDRIVSRESNELPKDGVASCPSLLTGQVQPKKHNSAEHSFAKRSSQAHNILATSLRAPNQECHSRVAKYTHYFAALLQRILGTLKSNTSTPSILPALVASCLFGRWPTASLVGWRFTQQISALLRQLSNLPAATALCTKNFRRCTHCSYNLMRETIDSQDGAAFDCCQYHVAEKCRACSTTPN